MHFLSHCAIPLSSFEKELSFAYFALLIAVTERDSKRVVFGLKRNGIEASIIGKVVEKKKGVKIRENGKLKNLKFFERDEITKIF